MTRDEAAKIVEDYIRDPKPSLIDERGFWKRLWSSIRIGGKVKKNGAEITIKGGAEF
jgi:hypothetical protein